MKQIIQSYRTGELELKDVPASLCKDKGVLIRTSVSLVSAGTEKGMIELAKKSILDKAMARPDLVGQVLGKIKEDGIITTAKKVFSKLDNPIALGYSCSGEIVEVGKGVDEFKIGDRVACAGTDYASHAEFNFVPKNLCVPIPVGVDFEEASFVALGAIAMQGIRRCELGPGEKVGVIGLGLIGQLVVQILSAYGFSVLGIDPDERKVNRSLKLGLDKGLVLYKNNAEEMAMLFSGEQGLDAVIVAASAEDNGPLKLAGNLCRQGGKVSVIGLVGMEIPRDIYYKKELELRFSRSYGPGRYDVNYEEGGRDYPYSYVRWTEKRNMEEFLRLIQSRKVNPRALITHKFKLEDYEAAYKLLLENIDHEDYIGILLEYDKDAKAESSFLFNRTMRKRQDKKMVNVGLIGAGGFAKDFILPALKRNKNVNIKAIATATGKNAKDIGDKYKSEYCATDYRDILNDPGIDTLFIATRHDLHAELVEEALKNSKNVFVEKPLCLNEDELARITAAYKLSVSSDRAPLLMVGFNRRFSPCIVKAKMQFSNRVTPLMINYRINAGYLPSDHWAHGEEGGGRIIGEVCHFVDLIQFLTGSVPVKVYATRLSPNDKISADDNLSVVLSFADGSQGNILYTALGDKSIGKEYIEIFGNGASAVIDDFKSRGLIINKNKGHLEEIDAFLKSVLNGGDAPIPPNEIFLSTLATLKIYESLRVGMPVNIDPAEIMDKK